MSRRIGVCWSIAALTLLIHGGVARATEVWSQQGPALKSSDAKPDAFGSSVAIYGDTLVVGAAGRDSGANTQQGAAYVFVRNGTTWSAQGGPLLAADGATNDRLGSSVAIYGDTVIVGAPNRTIGGKSNQGAAYVFVRTGSVWTQQGPALTASDGTADDNFPSAVALSGNTALLGVGTKDIGENDLQGATYAFVRNGTTWSQQGAPLARSDVGAYQAFGNSVALDGETALSAALFTGNGYVYRRSGTTWSLETQTPLHVGNDYLDSVALSGDTALLSSLNEARVFTRSGSNWTQQGPSLPGGGGNQVRAGISGDALVIGLTVYMRSAGIWTSQGPLATTGGATITGYVSVGISGHTVVVSGSGTGLVYAFTDVCASDVDCVATAYCSAARCLARCTADADCAAGTFCPPDGVCKAQLTQGSACDQTAGAQCKAAGCRVCAGGKPCVDGFCCESACSGTCEACSGKLSGGINGACRPVPPDKDPQNECPTDADPTSCLADGACSGQRSCRRFAKPGSPCGKTTCETGSIAGDICNGGGTCETSSASCAPYACSADRCATECTTDDDCAATGAYCLDGSCTNQKRVGESCEAADECGTGFCVDSVCCNQACDGQCEACSEQGECLPVQGEPQGAREPCAGDSELCGGQCDGIDATRCSYAPASKVCGQSCEDGVASLAKCDTAGACDEPKTSSCGGYACGSDACLSACASDRDCADGFGCADGKCMGGSTCSDDLQATIVLGKKPVSCGAYLCDPKTLACRSDCQSIDDCSVGNACDDTGHCAPVRDAATDTGGCGCRLAASPTDTRSQLGWLILLGIIATRRRAARES